VIGGACAQREAQRLGEAGLGKHGQVQLGKQLLRVEGTLERRTLVVAHRVAARERAVRVERKTLVAPAHAHGELRIARRQGEGLATQRGFRQLVLELGAIGEVRAHVVRARGGQARRSRERVVTAVTDVRSAGRRVDQLLQARERHVVVQDFFARHLRGGRVDIPVQRIAQIAAQAA